MDYFVYNARGRASRALRLLQPLPRMLYSPTILEFANCFLSVSILVIDPNEKCQNHACDHISALDNHKMYYYLCNSYHHQQQQLQQVQQLQVQQKSSTDKTIKKKSCYPHASSAHTTTTTTTSTDSKANEAAAARPKELEVEYLGEEDEDEEEEDEEEEDDDDDEERGQGKEGPSSQHRLSPRLHDIEEEDDEDHGRNTRERVQRRRHRSASRRAPGIGLFSDEKGLLIESSGAHSAAPEQKHQQQQQRYSSIIARGMEKLFARAVYRHSYCTARSSDVRLSLALHSVYYQVVEH
ncbi:unnamed protein product [Trichogramma brassicae]|uniref:Uncharacterized protein n=1 Tax=Trichogramma brassicae TaxID=86971 RepID=A0A6H5I4S4_9HYME|nr:unnamed protein product [Trichogramma brassicae]